MYWKQALTTIKQYAFPGRAALEHELSAARAENLAVSQELESARAEFDTAQARDRQHISELGRQLAELETEYLGAQQQIRLLEASRQEADRRQAHAEQQIRALQDRLEEEHNRHESSLSTTRETLEQLQTEQQDLLTLQSNLARTFNEFGKQLLESMRLDVARPKQPVLPLAAMASMLLLAVLLVGAVTVRGFQDGTRVLAEVGQGIRDLQISIKHHISKQDELLLELTDALNRNTVRAIVPPPATAPVNGDSGAGKARQLPAATSGSASERWGPPLLLPDAAAPDTTGTLVFDPQVKEQQINLMTLGFNIGRRHADGLQGPLTQQALDEFRTLYQPVAGLPDVPDETQLATALGKFAALAREDEQRFKVDSGVLAAIRLGSLRTGVEFSFLMELAAVESTFDPASKAPSSSAAGLYQFKGSTWLDAVRIHGSKYGIGEYAAQVEYTVNSEGQRRPVIHDPLVSRHVLDLRYNPRISALLAAEYVRKNMRRLSYSLDREPGRTELYLMHFLGARGAISFLKALDEDPDKIAVNIFPGAARRNQNIFLTEQSKPRTVAEVYEIFSRKFNTARYAEGDSG